MILACPRRRAWQRTHYRRSIDIGVIGAESIRTSAAGGFVLNKPAGSTGSRCRLHGVCRALVCLALMRCWI